MNVSVVISSSRPDKILKRCVWSLHEQTVQPHEVIVVVDSEDQVREVPGATVYASNNKGTTAARNFGIEKATGDIIAFIDDDACAEADWIEHIIRSMCEKTLVVGGPVSPVFEGKPLPEKWWWIIGCTSKKPLTTRPISCNMAVNKKVLQDVCLFSEVGKKRMEYSMGEETDLCLRIEKAFPYSTIWNPMMKVNHVVPARRTKMKHIICRAFKEGVGKAVISESHPMNLEQKFLSYYLTHPDRYTIPVLSSVFVGFGYGKVKKWLN